MATTKQTYTWRWSWEYDGDTCPSPAPGREYGSRDEAQEAIDECERLYACHRKIYCVLADLPAEEI